MKPKKQFASTILKFVLLSLFLCYLFHTLVAPKFSSFDSSYPPFQSTCNKIPHTLSKSLLFFATTTTKPQQKLNELTVTFTVLQNKSPCNFLVFGLGHDSTLWASLNHGGRTVFLEENKYWIIKVKDQMPNSLETYHVAYDSKASQADELLNIGKTKKECQSVSDPRISKCPLVEKNFPNEVYETEWDLIMIDAPTGFKGSRPGRMKAIYTAGLLARNRRVGETHVFVHDVYRDVESNFSSAFLCDGYLMEEVEALRHFTIPSHKNGREKPFCP